MIAAGVTFVIGKVFMKHFASGGTLLDFDPPDYREFIKEQQEKVNEQVGRGKSSGSTLLAPPPGLPDQAALGGCRESCERAVRLDQGAQGGVAS